MNASEEATNPTTATEPDGFREVITLDEGKVKSHLARWFAIPVLSHALVASMVQFLPNSDPIA